MQDLFKKILEVRSYLYRVIQEERSMWEVLVSVTVRKKVHVNACPIPIGYPQTELSESTDTKVL